MTKKLNDTIAAKEVLEVAKKDAKMLIQTSVVSAKNVIETARVTALKATEDANNLMETARLQAIKVLEVAQAQAQGKGQSQDQGLFLDLKRIPLICEKIIQIHASLERIEKSMVNIDQFNAVKSDLVSLGDNQKWVVRSIIAIVIAGIMGLLFKLK